MRSVFINGLGSISAQKTFDNAEFLEDLMDHEDNVLTVINPNYKEFIPPAAARRMAKGIKMGVVASKIALNEAGQDNVDAIITGTGMGCVRDSEKFVSAIIDNDEQYLTPTSFIQSTHNTVGGQIALELQCKGYNFTYVHSSNSFESALLDAQLKLALDEEQSILVGGVDEIGDHTIKIHKLIGHIKSDPVKSSELLIDKSPGAVFSEGANFFVLSNHKQDSSYAELIDVNIFNSLDQSNLHRALDQFLGDNNLSPESVDLLILGINGDSEYDGFYDELCRQKFNTTQQAYYKHLSGEFNTASSFGFWLASKILRSQTLPAITKLNDIPTENYRTVLLYNQYRGENHSFTLLRSC